MKKSIFIIVFLTIILGLNASSFLGISPNANGEYVINNKCDLKGAKVYCPAGAVIRFDGGSIINGTLVGQSTYVSASQCKIFDNIEFLGRFCSTFEVEWLGAKADNRTDNSAVFNKAFSTNAILNWHAGCGYYVIKNSVHISQRISFICDGTINADNVSDAFIIESHCVCLTIKNMTTTEGRESSKASAISIVDNSQYNNITIYQMCGFNKGINLAPRTNSKKGAGVSYNIFTWQRMTCNECIVFDLNGENDGEGLWITENQFNGGQLEGGVGIIQHGRNNKAHRIHGNVFNCISFEGLDKPIQGLYRWYCDSFHDLRMSTGENKEVISCIEMENCEDIYIKIKAKLASDKISAKNCINCYFETAGNNYVSGKKSNPELVNKQATTKKYGF